MNCPRCGAPLVQRNRTRLLMTGVLFLAGAVVFVLLVRMPVTVLAAVLLAVGGIHFVTWAVKAKGLWCPKCRRIPARAP